MNQALLYGFVFSAVISVVVILFTRVVFFAALALLACLLSLAAIYALLKAEFLAVTQLVIYAGGVIVLILFGIMLTNRISGKALITETQHVFTSMLVFTGLLILIGTTYLQISQVAVVNFSNPNTSIQQTGIELMSTYVAPFEISGILLLVCLVGAAFTASSFKDPNHE